MIHAHKHPSPIDKLDHLYRELEQPEDKQISEIEKTEQLDPEQSLAFLIDSHRKQRRVKILIGVIVGLLILSFASVAGFFYFSKKLNAPEEKISINVEGPQKAKIRESITYKVTIKNSGKIESIENKINILKPAGFWITSTKPEKSNHVWNLGNLAPFENKTLEIIGYFVDDIEAIETMKATLTFTPKNFSSTFSASAEFQTMLEPFDLTLTSIAPTSVAASEKAKIIIEYSLPGILPTAPLEKIKLKIIPTSELQLLTFSPKTEKNEPEWIIPIINPGGKGTVEFEFTTRNDLDVKSLAEEQKFIAQILAGDNNDNFFPVSDHEIKINLTSQELLVYLIVNGATTDKTISLGETLNCSLVYKNKSKKTYSNIEAKVTIAAEPLNLLDWNKLTDKNLGNLTSTNAGKEIMWTKQQIPNFKELKPGVDSMFTFSIPIKTRTDFKIGDNPALANGSIVIQPLLNVKDTTGNALFTINGNKTTLTLNSDLAFSNKALFFFEDGTPIGSGPLPPKVGQTTKYKIFWTIKNSLHDLTKISATTTLPTNVNFTNEVSKTAGEVTFDTKTRQLTWSISDLPATTTEIAASFFVELKPTSADVGKIVKLTENTTLLATDKKTNATISSTISTLTSNLDNDPYGKGTGVVQK
ncbi:hypothetical protein HY932_01970 [Candidatus Falkowbacteria bacterium]|nr:hypothetical protein [Candidatus Falkowbacteria bacterium]